ncbi:YbaB/EbfC family nucleoid-associated protein [Nocardia sp. NPDC051990]|uniref:YbaB/EbfC family nucleoid-associated protein n=1 Tax=Nocardia sp. NPDC051990 TaxID=3155285 RepID=UPI0034357693
MRDSLREQMLAEVMEGMREQIDALKRAQEQRADMVVTGSAASGLVTVALNADGAILETRFAPGVADLTRRRLAEAVTAAIRDAQAEVARRNAELFEPVLGARLRQPKLADLMPDLPDIDRLLPKAPPVRTRMPVHGDSEQWEFADAVTLREAASQRGPATETTESDSVTEVPAAATESGESYDEGFRRDRGSGPNDLSW